MRKSDYNRRKEAAREAAIKWQWEFDGRELDWLTLSIETAAFEKLARRFGLVREFRENGII